MAATRDRAYVREIARLEKFQHELAESVVLAVVAWLHHGGARLAGNVDADSCGRVERHAVKGQKRLVGDDGGEVVCARALSCAATQAETKEAQQQQGARVCGGGVCSLGGGGAWIGGSIGGVGGVGVG
eukprot:6185086-Pleurochrysis_carterae.AAC.2